jgi:glucose dehydrogenase
MEVNGVFGLKEPLRRRNRWTRLRLGAPVSIVALLSTVLIGRASTSAPGASNSLPFTPPEVSNNRDQWPLPGKDYANSRAQLDSRITTENVARLKPAWSVPLPGSSAFGNAATTPLIVGNTVYVQDLSSNVHAIDLESGSVRWTRTYDEPNQGPNGVAVGYGRVFAVTEHAVVALDAKTGKQLWSRRLSKGDTDGVDIQPTVVAGMVFASTVPATLRGSYVGGDRGVLWALDARTGKPRWTFDTVKGDLWGNPTINSGGGAWSPPVIDAKNQMIYWGTGNPGPVPGTKDFPSGTSRPGPNLYTDSVVALRLRSGVLAWYRQVTPHDLLDHDLQFVLRSDVDRSGAASSRLIATGKAGRVVVLDPRSGRVTSNTPIGLHDNDDVTQLAAPTKITPGLFGGVLAPPATATGIAYLATLNAGNTYTSTALTASGLPLGTAPGDVVAVDVGNGSVIWDTAIDGDPTGGTTVLGDLVLTVTYQGTITALDRTSGQLLATWLAPGGVNGWPAATSDTIVWPVGLGDTPELVAYRVGP